MTTTTPPFLQVLTPPLEAERGFCASVYWGLTIGCTRRGVILCERTCFCLLSTFYETLPSKNPSKNLVFTKILYRRLLGTLLRSTFKEPSKNPSKSRVLLHDSLGVHPGRGVGGAREFAEGCRPLSHHSDWSCPRTLSATLGSAPAGLGTHRFVSSQKFNQEWPRQTKPKNLKRSVHELFLGAFRNKSSM